MIATILSILHIENIKNVKGSSQLLEKIVSKYTSNFSISVNIRRDSLSSLLALSSKEYHAIYIHSKLQGNTLGDFMAILRDLNLRVPIFLIIDENEVHSINLAEAKSAGFFCILQKQAMTEYDYFCTVTAAHDIHQTRLQEGKHLHIAQPISQPLQFSPCPTYSMSNANVVNKNNNNNNYSRKRQSKHLNHDDNSRGSLVSNASDNYGCCSSPKHETAYQSPHMTLSPVQNMNESHSKRRRFESLNGDCDVIISASISNNNNNKLSSCWGAEEDATAFNRIEGEKCIQKENVDESFNMDSYNVFDDIDLFMI